MINKTKPYGGTITSWFKRYFDLSEYKDLSPNLGYRIWGVFTGPGEDDADSTYGYTSPVIAQEGHEVETLNKWYILLTKFSKET